MTIKVFQKGFNYSQDGPGNRLVYHLQGCNMHCPWCANPEGMSLKGSLFATDAFLLESICPNGAIQNQNLAREICQTCVGQPCLAHKTKGLRRSCTEYEIEEIVSEAIRSKPLFYDNGGVTFTGGEPTCQFNSLAEVLKRLKEQGIHTALETNASHPQLSELLPYIDVLMMDFKHWDDTVLRQVTGVSAKSIRRNLEWLLANGAPVQVRIPLVDGFNASAKDLEGFLAYFKTLDFGKSTLEILPFHEYGRDKWKQCGLAYTMQGGHIAQNVIEMFCQTFSKNGIAVVRT